jgi:hypothetical protein
MRKLIDFIKISIAAGVLFPHTSYGNRIGPRKGHWLLFINLSKPITARLPFENVWRGVNTLMSIIPCY